MIAITTRHPRRRSMIRASQSSPALMLSRSDETNTSMRPSAEDAIASLRRRASRASDAAWPMNTVRFPRIGYPSAPCRNLVLRAGERPRPSERLLGTAAVPRKGARLREIQPAAHRLRLDGDRPLEGAPRPGEIASPGPRRADRVEDRLAPRGAGQRLVHLADRRVGTPARERLLGAHEPVGRGDRIRERARPPHRLAGD